MICYRRKNEDGEVIQVGQVEETGQIPAGCEACAQEEYDAWLEERRALAEERASQRAVEPTAAEQLRADVDFLAAMAGVTL